MSDLKTEKIQGTQQCPACQGKGEIWVDAVKENPKRITARKLREAGKTYKEIADIMELKSTSVAHYYVKGRKNYE